MFGQQDSYIDNTSKGQRTQVKGVFVVLLDA